MIRNTIKNIVYKYRHPLNNYKLVRIVQSNKSVLIHDVRDLYIKYTEWTTKKQENDVVFIFIDETYCHFRGHFKKKLKITKLKETDLHLYVRFDSVK